MVQHLGKYLGKVREITGSLKISRTYALVSLDFFENLRYIRGKNTHGENEYSLTILENENLQKLFSTRPDGGTVRILRTEDDGRESDGNALIHYNARLCKKEIKAMIRDSGLYDPGENSADISYATNGHKAICGSRKLDVKLEKVGSRITLLRWENYKQTIKDFWPAANVRTLLGYEIHYREISKVTYEKHNLTKYDGRDACGGDDWIVLDKMPSTTISKSNDTLYWPQETDFLKVKPYSYYAYFISTLLLKEYAGSQGVQGAESDIKYFHTPEDIPEPPVSVRVAKTSYSSLNITWEPPEVPNGVIDHYEVVLTLNEINPARLINRPYCTDSGKVVQQKEDKKSRVFVIPSKAAVNKTLPEGVCDCDTCGALQPKNNGIKDTVDKMEEEIFFDAVINIIFESPNSPLSPGPSSGGREKRSVSGQLKKDSGALEENAILPEEDVDDGKTFESQNNNETAEEEEEEEEEEDDVEVEKDGLERVPVKNSVRMGEGPKDPMPYSVAKKLPDGGKIYKVFAARVDGDRRSLYVPNLKHYGGYTITVRACQQVRTLDTDGSLIATGNVADLGEDGRGGSQDGVRYEKFCSMDVVREERVLHKPGADDIESDVWTSVQNDTNRVWLSWHPPSDPNELILNYIVELKSKQDSAGSTECVTAKDFKDANYRFRPDRTGSYYVRVRAVSVYGQGAWTKYKWITVPGETGTLVVAVVVPIIFVLLVLVVLTAFYQYRRSKQPEYGPNVVSFNGLYCSVGELYKVDEWEVEREKVVIGEELGSGAFGRVHKGTYDDPDKGLIECAIKTVKEGASHAECIQFLQEAQTMK